MPYETQQDEILDRVRRTETKVTALGQKLGVVMKEEQRCRVYPDIGVIVLDDMDISVSAVVRAARQAGLHGKKVAIEFENTVLTTSFQV